MGTELIRYGDGKYVVWNDVSDGPEKWGSRDECTEHMAESIRQRYAERVALEIEQLADRFERADKYGGSSRTHRVPLTPDDVIVFAGPEGDGYILHGNLEAFLDSWVEDEVETETGGTFARADLIVTDAIVIDPDDEATPVHFVEAPPETGQEREW